YCNWFFNDSGRHFRIIKVCFILLLLLLLPSAVRAAGAVFLEERFESLDRWQPLTFPKIARHSTYTAVRCETGSCLLMESDNSASALVLKQPFNVYAHPMLSWRWKVSNVYRKGDSRTASGRQAMVTGEPWMYHSHLSFYLNCGLLLPLALLLQLATRAKMARRRVVANRRAPGGAGLGDADDRRCGLPRPAALQRPRHSRRKLGA
ncbi:MAG: DUF3047 domain-containing protein, partial [Oscillochloris sp.]|nr:DUF3047 domain-containing protein [Oscillochloris sp.]